MSFSIYTRATYILYNTSFQENINTHSHCAGKHNKAKAGKNLALSERLKNLKRELSEHNFFKELPGILSDEISDPNDSDNISNENLIST